MVSHFPDLATSPLDESEEPFPIAQLDAMLNELYTQLKHDIEKRANAGASLSKGESVLQARADGGHVERYWTKIERALVDDAADFLDPILADEYRPLEDRHSTSPAADE